MKLYFELFRVLKFEQGLLYLELFGFITVSNFYKKKLQKKGFWRVDLKHLSEFMSANFFSIWLVSIILTSASGGSALTVGAQGITLKFINCLDIFTTF